MLRVGTGSDANGFGLTVTGGDLAAGASKTVTAAFAGDNQTPGVQSATVRLLGTSIGQAGTGLADATPDAATASVSVSGDVYRLATVSVTPLNLSLGSVRAGIAPSAQHFSVGNTASSDGFSDDLATSLSSASGGFGLSSISEKVVAPGAAYAFTAIYSGETAVAGLKNEPATYMQWRL